MSTDPDIDIAGANAKLDLLLDKAHSGFGLAAKLLAFVVHIAAIVWATAAFYFQVQGLEKEDIKIRKEMLQADTTLAAEIARKDLEYKDAIGKVAELATGNRETINQNQEKTNDQLGQIRVQLGKIEAILSFKPKEDSSK